MTFLASPTLEIILKIKCFNISPKSSSTELLLSCCQRNSHVCQPDEILFVLSEGDVLLGVLLSEAGVVGAEEEGDGGDAVLVGQGIVQDVVDDDLCGRRKLHVSMTDSVICFMKFESIDCNIIS